MHILIKTQSVKTQNFAKKLGFSGINSGFQELAQVFVSPHFLVWHPENMGIFQNTRGIFRKNKVHDCTLLVYMQSDRLHCKGLLAMYWLAIGHVLELLACYW